MKTCRRHVSTTIIHKDLEIAHTGAVTGRMTGTVTIARTVTRVMAIRMHTGTMAGVVDTGAVTCRMTGAMTGVVARRLYSGRLARDCPRDLSGGLFQRGCPAVADAFEHTGHLIRTQGQW